MLKSFGLKKPTGAVVAKIIEGGPAKKSGLKQGDIILKFNNKVVNKSRDLPLMVGATKVNKVVNVEILRDKKILIKRILIEELPEEEKIAGMKQNKITGAAGQLGGFLRLFNQPGKTSWRQAFGVLVKSRGNVLHGIPADEGSTALSMNVRPDDGSCAVAGFFPRGACVCSPARGRSLRPRPLRLL
mgnify:CR=1 FL=1